MIFACEALAHPYLMTYSVVSEYESERMVRIVNILDFIRNMMYCFLITRGVYLKSNIQLYFRYLKVIFRDRVDSIIDEDLMVTAFYRIF